MSHTAHHPTHTPRSADDEAEALNPTHLPVDPEMGAKVADVPGARPLEGGTELEG